MTYLLFEDSEESPVSKMLKASLYGEYICFSGGNELLLRKIKELLESYGINVIIYVFVDTVPDNENTILLYSLLKRVIKKKQLNNVYVIPYLCIEYTVLEFLVNYNILHCSEYLRDICIDIITKFEFFKTDSIKDIGENTGSLETRCKSVISHLKSCQHNENKRKNTLYGLFYTSDCTCEEKYCTVCSRYSLREKANLLCSFLPMIPESEIFNNFVRQFGRNVYSEDYNSVIQNQQLLYDKICDKCSCSKIRL